MALIDALRRGVLGTVRQLRQVGATAWSIAEYVRQQLPELSVRDVRSAVNAAIRGANVAGEYAMLTANERVAATSMQRIGGLPQQYQYVVTITFHGQGSGRPQYRTLTIDSDRNLTRGEIDARSLHLGRVLFMEGMGLAPVDVGIASGGMSIEVEYVFRSR